MNSSSDSPPEATIATEVAAATAEVPSVTPVCGDNCDISIPPAADVEEKVSIQPVQPVVAAKSNGLIHPFDNYENEDVCHYLNDMLSPFNPFSFLKSPSAPAFEPTSSRVRTEDSSPGLESLPLTFDFDHLIADSQFQSSPDLDINIGIGMKKKDELEEKHVDVSGDKLKPAKGSVEDVGEVGPVHSPAVKDDVPETNDDINTNGEIDVKKKQICAKKLAVKHNGTVFYDAQNGALSHPVEAHKGVKTELQITAEEELSKDKDIAVPPSDATSVAELKSDLPGTSGKGTKKQVVPLPSLDAIFAGELEPIVVPKRSMSSKVHGLVPPLKRCKPASLSIKEEAPRSPVEKSLAELIQSYSDIVKTEAKAGKSNEIKDLCNDVDYIVSAGKKKNGAACGNEAKNTPVVGTGKKTRVERCKDVGEDKKDVVFDLNYSFMKKMKNKNAHSKPVLSDAYVNGNKATAKKTRAAASVTPNLAAFDSDDDDHGDGNTNTNPYDNESRKFAPLFPVEHRNKKDAAKPKQAFPTTFDARSIPRNCDNFCGVSAFLKAADPLKDTCAAESLVFKNGNGNCTRKPGSSNDSRKLNTSDKLSNLGNSKYFADFYDNSIFKPKQAPIPNRVKNAGKKEDSNAWNVFSDEVGTKVCVPKTNSGRYFGRTPSEPSLVFNKSTTSGSPPASRGFGGTSFRYFHSPPPPASASLTLLTRGYKSGNRNGYSYGSGRKSNGNRTVQEKWYLDFRPKGASPINKNNTSRRRYSNLEKPRHNVNYSYIIAQARDMLARVEKCEKEFQDTYSKKVLEEKNSHKKFLTAKKQMLKAKCVTRQWTAFRTNVHGLKDDIRQFLASFH